MKAKVDAVCIAVGNGGRNVLNWFAKQEGLANYHDYLELIAVDTDARKLDLAEGEEIGIRCIRLVDEEHEAFGTGGDIGKEPCRGQYLGPDECYGNVYPPQGQRDILG
jgi:cell division GTPase FtsZ